LGEMYARSGDPDVYLGCGCKEEIADTIGTCEREKRMCEYTRPHGVAHVGIMARVYI
jgi:hypothetical protein